MLRASEPIVNTASTSPPTASTHSQPSPNDISQKNSQEEINKSVTKVNTPHYRTTDSMSSAPPSHAQQGGKYPAKTVPSPATHPRGLGSSESKAPETAVTSSANPQLDAVLDSLPGEDPEELLVEDSTPSTQQIQQQEPVTELNRMRVRIYELTTDSHWLDRGTGFCQVTYVEVRSIIVFHDYNCVCVYMQSKDAICIVVLAEHSDVLLMESPILKEDAYQKQQGTLYYLLVRVCV
jgi:hypothetical protein